MRRNEKISHVPMDRWGKDHWSTFAYAETRCVDYDGYLDPRHLRLDGDKYPTRLAYFEQLSGHTDLDCLLDAEREGLLTISRATQRDGKGEVLRLTYHVELTALGKRVAGQLRAHKASGGQFKDFHMVKEPI